MQLINQRAASASGWNLRRPFLRFDKDGSRSLDFEEMSSALRSLGVPHDKATVSAVMAAFDRNGDGSVDYGEFLFVFMNRRKLVRQWKREGGGGEDDDAKRAELREYLLGFTAPGKRQNADGSPGSLTRLELQVALSKRGVDLTDWETEAMLDSLEQAGAQLMTPAPGVPTRIPVEYVIEFMCSDDDGQFVFGQAPTHVQPQHIDTEPHRVSLSSAALSPQHKPWASSTAGLPVSRRKRQ